jgi:hypothetical protein
MNVNIYICMYMYKNAHRDLSANCNTNVIETVQECNQIELILLISQ